jgi:hypothetical protein
VVGLASLDGNADGWDVAPLVATCMAEIGAAELTEHDAATIVARLVASALPAASFPAVRYLATLAPALEYPDGVIGEAYYLEEWLDCECHEGSDERQAAVEFERRLRADPLACRAEIPTAIFGARGGPTRLRLWRPTN